MRILLLLGLFCVIQAIQASSDLLKVSVFYESLCPDSIRFIRKQLYPAYQKIGSSLSIDFVPYGKATQSQVNGQWKFKCQHGANECWGNKAQACGLAEGKGQDKDVAFVNCVMGQSYPAAKYAIEKCAPELGTDSAPILECANNKKGDELLAHNGDRTHNVDPIITFVPTIIFNDVYDSKVQSGSLRNFLKTACGALTTKHANCPPDSDEFFMNLF